MNNILPSTLLLSLLFIAGGSTVYGQAASDETLAARVKELEHAVRLLQEQFAGIRNIVGAQKPAGTYEDIDNLQIPLGDSAFRGSRNAKLVLIEYSDFQCPYCGRHAAGTYRDIDREYIATGRLLYVYRHLPIENIHPLALKAAEAVECAGQAGKFWEMHDRLFANQSALAENALSIVAKDLELDDQKFETCFRTGSTTSKVRQDAAQAREYGARVTPTFFLGELVGDGVVRVRSKISGAQPFAVFQESIERLAREQQGSAARK